MPARTANAADVQDAMAAEVGRRARRGASRRRQVAAAEVDRAGRGGAGRFASCSRRPPSATNAGNDINMILDIPVQLTVELGRTKIPIKHILQLAQGSVVELDALAGEPMDVLVNGYLIAQGEVVVVNDKFGIRLTDIVTPSERMRRLRDLTDGAKRPTASSLLLRSPAGFVVAARSRGAVAAQAHDRWAAAGGPRHHADSVRCCRVGRQRW